MSPKPAFLAPILTRTTFLSTPFLNFTRPRLHHHAASKRRFHIWANSNLYPEPDSPDSARTPENQQPSPSDRYQDEQRLFNELNARQKSRGDHSRVSKTTLDASADASSQRDSSRNPVLADAPSEDLDYKSAARALWRLGWFTWWIQLILTVISGVILLFSFAFPGVKVGTSASIFGFVLSGLGVLLAFFSLFWTYSYTRLSLWLRDEVKRTAEVARARITGKLKVGLVLALIGLIVSLLGTQAIVGTLLAKLLSSGVVSTSGTVGGSLPSVAGIVQPVDVLVIQACANAMMAMTASLTVTVWLRGRSRKWLESKQA